MKYALIIGNNKYNDPKLAQLKTPAADSQALAKILDDKTIGSFDEVTPLINQTETQVRRAISFFLTNKRPDDLVLLYFSGHGILDDRGRLYLALKDTQVNLLKATSIPSSFIADEMDSCRSKRQILILDCCHSGAFERGTKGEQKAITETTFEGSGFGRVVLTASNSTQYALEGDQVIKQTELSLFTHFLLEGLKNGEADVNNDGLISLDEWYDYTYTKVISETPRQVPHKWSYNQQGDLIIAKNPYLKKKVVELPYELVQALESSFVGIRESALNELGKYLRSRDSEMIDLAISSLEKMKGDDSRRISSLAERLLSEFEQTRNPVNKVMPSKPATKIEPEVVNIADDNSVSTSKLTTEVKSPLAEARTSQLEVKKVKIHSDRSSTFAEMILNKSSLSKWIGTIIVAVVLSLIIYLYNLSVYSASNPMIVVELAVVAGLSSFIQWSLFRDRLKIGWVGTNTIAGIALGLLHNYLYNIEGLDWWSLHLGILLAVWLVGNFVLGRTLVEGPKARSNTLSAQPAIELIETSTRQNIFFIFLSTSLVLFALLVFSAGLGLTSAAGIFKVLHGIANILVGFSFFLKKKVPRNFGFIALALFSLLFGIMVEIDYFTGSIQQALFSLPALLSLLAGIFFASQKETRQDFAFLMLSGYLISLSAAQITIDYSAIDGIFSFISALLGLAAAFFFLRK
jgi:hypothetical protein